MTSWCILRTAPSRTLSLAAGLQSAGYRAWTPEEKRMVRIGPCRKQQERSSPMVPTIVFADYERLPEFVFMSRAAVRSVPDFHVFRHLDIYPRVSDRALDALRLAEQRGRPREQARVYGEGDAVTFADAGFEGLVGVVAGRRGRYTLVDFPGFSFPVHIDAHYLLPAQPKAA